MGVKHTIILTFIFVFLLRQTSAQCHNGAPTRNLIASALQDILSTTNTEGALQMLKMAAGSTRKPLVPETPLPVRTILPKAPDNLPSQTYVANEMPRPILANEIPMPYVMANKEIRMVRPTEIGIPRVMANNEVMAFMDPNEIVIPRVIANKEMLIGPNEMVMPRVMRKVLPDVCERQIYGKTIMEPNRNLYEYRVVDYPPILREEVKCPCSTNPLVNPFLPVASTVSAFTPTSSNMLPPPTQGRSQYLRKIPIPPPTL